MSSTPSLACRYFISLIHSAMFTLMLILFQVSSCDSSKSDHQRTIYYIHPNGNDNHSGASPEHAWRSIAKINSVHFQPGDQILFEGGFTYPGTLVFDSSDGAAAENRLLVTSRGQEPACINGGDDGALVADGCNYLTIKKLQFEGNGRQDGNSTEGAFLTRSHFVEMDSIEIWGFQHSGLRLHICDHARITNITAHDNGFAGIHVTGTTVWDTTRYDNHDIYIGSCATFNNPGDPSVTDNHSGSGIVVSSTDGGMIEYCQAFNNGWDMQWNGNGPVGIWIWDSSNFIIQHNISHDNKSAPDAADGGGFDFDGGVSNSTLQYNLSYNNQGPGIGLFEFGAAKVWQNNIVRYNISIDDGKNGQGSLAVWRGEAGGTIRNCEIDHNTFYNRNPQGPNLCIQNNWSGFIFRNNVFVYNGPFLMAGNKLQDEKFINNCYWNLAGNAEFLNYPDLNSWAKATGNEMQQGRFVGIYADPNIMQQELASLTSPLLLRDQTQRFFAPNRFSPLIDAGLDLSLAGLNAGKYDIYGKQVPLGEGYDIGAVEYSGD